MKKSSLKNDTMNESQLHKVYTSPVYKSNIYTYRFKK